MFEMPIFKRLSQLFCRHNYFVVAVTENYQEPNERKHEKATIYKCEQCEHVEL